MAIGEDIRLHYQNFTNYTFDGKSSTVDLRVHSLDYHAAASILRECRGLGKIVELFLHPVQIREQLDSQPRTPA